MRREEEGKDGDSQSIDWLILDHHLQWVSVECSLPLELAYRGGLGGVQDATWEQPTDQAVEETNVVTKE